jgi:hypothetical protein
MSGRRARASDDELEQLVVRAFEDERVTVDAQGTIFLDGRPIRDKRIERAFDDAIANAVISAWLLKG